MDEIELAYVERKPVRWYQHRRFYRFVILVAMLWSGWFVFLAIPPIWDRYRCYRMQEQAREFVTTPDRILLDDVLPAPAVSHVSSSAVQFQKELWASRSKAGLGTLASNMLSSTPVFCQQLTTASGSERVVQIYAALSVCPAGRSLSLMATTCRMVNREWVIWPSKDETNLAFTFTTVAMGQLSCAAQKSLSVTGAGVV